MTEKRSITPKLDGGRYTLPDLSEEEKAKRREAVHEAVRADKAISRALRDLKPNPLEGQLKQALAACRAFGATRLTETQVTTRTDGSVVCVFTMDGGADE